MSASRRGEPEARTNFGRPIMGGRKLMEGVPLLNFSLLFIHRSGSSEPVPNLLHELVAHGAIGIEALLAIAFDRGRIGRRPIFDRRRHTITQSQRLMMLARHSVMIRSKSSPSRSS